MADPSLAPQPQHQPAPKVDPQPRAKPKPNAPAGSGSFGPGAPTRVDATRTTRLLLRDAAKTAGAALVSDGPARQAGLVEAATRMTSAFHEIAVLADLQPIAWHQLAAELSSILVASKKLGGALRGAELPTLDREIAASAARLEAKVDPNDWAAAEVRNEAVPMPALSGPERLELARLAIAAAVKQTAIARAAATKKSSSWAEEDRDRDGLIRHLQPAQIHIAIAIDAAGSIAATQQRKPLKPDVLTLSQEMSELTEVIKMAPMLGWDLSLASLFDSENQLRSLLGLDQATRPYTGTIDPSAALKLFKQEIDPNGDQGKTPKAKMVYTDPQAAVAGIAVHMNHIFSQRIYAVQRLKSDLKEPPPANTSILVVLLEVAVNVVLAAVGGGIGAAVAEKLRGPLERLAKSAASDQVAKEAGRLSEKARTALIDERVKESTLRRAVIIDTAKDGAKRLFLEPSMRALASTKPTDVNAGEPLNAYIQHLQNVLSQAHFEAESAITHFASALGQLDLATLNAFVDSLGDMHKEANRQQYDISVREWQNLRARLASPSVDTTRPNDPNLDAPRKSMWSEEAIPGVLEIGLEVNRGFSGPLVGFKYLVLRDGEAAAIRHLRQYPRRIPDAGLNRQYQLVFPNEDPRSFMALNPEAPEYPNDGGWPVFVKVGVGVKHGFQPSSLKHEELRLLKLFISRPVTKPGLSDAYLLKAYDSVSDEKAIALVKEILVEVDDVTTAKLED